jgi:probable phosphoglycerate mutase
MRHGAVEYIAPDGRRYASDERPLSASGRAQARAAGCFLRDAGVVPDRVMTSNLPRTIETAAEVLAALDVRIAIEQVPGLKEIASGKVADIPAEDLESEYARAFVGVIPESRQYLRGERFGSMIDRVYREIDRIAADTRWDVLLLVLHGAINRAILSYALTGTRTYLGNFQQSAGCVNVLDLGADWVVRAVNIAPTDPAHTRTRSTTMEEQFQHYLAAR